MKTVFITTSRKKHFNLSNSTYMAYLTGLFSGEDCVRVNMRSKADYPKIIDACKEAECIVIATSVYVDSLPSHVIRFLKDIEDDVRGIGCKVYVVCNCAFYEGEQCDILLEQISCWCERAGLGYCGGIGVGTGEMLGVIRFINLIGVPVFGALAAFVSYLCSGDILSAAGLWGIICAVSVLLFVLWSSGLFRCTYLLGKAIKERKYFGEKYTTVSFCNAAGFNFFAYFFWVARAVKNGLPPWKFR